MKSDTQKSCCAPVRRIPPLARKERKPGRSANARKMFETALIPGGKSLVGTNAPFLTVDGEGPLRRKSLRPFRMMSTTVTNDQFMQFVTETGYVTEAETFGWSFVFYSDVPETVRTTLEVVGAEWWRKVDGATWRTKNGPGSEDTYCADHPVVQVSWNDAAAFAEWCGGRFPTEAEWEHAARGGLGDVPFPWGSEEPDDQEYLPCNIWQGQFPTSNTGADGWSQTAPARSFDPNGYGLYNMVGNVWEWTAEPFRVRSLKKTVRERFNNMKGFKLLKGGSFLCHRSYCYRYRIAARSGNSPETATPHQGFRLVWDA